jgi:uncharacterized protein YlzI (FlbEa/FlbD family)
MHKIAAWPTTDTRTADGRRFVMTRSTAEVNERLVLVLNRIDELRAMGKRRTGTQERARRELRWTETAQPIPTRWQMSVTIRRVA